MSCNTNEKSIDLPASINLHTPMEPLTEEDDILREKACEASADEEEEHEMEIGVDGEVAVAPNDDTLSHHTPKLSITMPSSHVVEISQNFYWPLYSRPIDWIYQEHVLETCSTEDLESRTRKIAEEFRELEFFKSVGVETANETDVSPEESMIQHIHQNF